MMRSLLLDELTHRQMDGLRILLARTCQASPLPGLYWWPLPIQLLSPLQRQHQPACGPYRLALSLEERGRCLKMELLLRAENNLHCSCLAMVTPPQLEVVWAFWHELIAALENWEGGQAPYGSGR
jgi:hypothetical protein